MFKYVFIAILRLGIVVTPLPRASMKIPWLGTPEGSGILDLRDAMLFRHLFVVRHHYYFLKVCFGFWNY